MGSYADTMSSVAAGNARRAANTADTNFKGIYTLLQMGIDITDTLREMRNFHHQRFNDMVYSMRELNVEIQDLKAQIAGIQKRLYKQEKRSEEVAENSSALEEIEHHCPEEIEP